MAEAALGGKNRTNIQVCVKMREEQKIRAVEKSGPASWKETVLLMNFGQRW